jgi:hypothetical protein
MNSRKASAAADRELTPPYARYLVPLIRPFPNFDLFFVKSLRQRAVRRYNSVQEIALSTLGADRVAVSRFWLTQ